MREMEFLRILFFKRTFSGSSLLHTPLPLLFLGNSCLPNHRLVSVYCFGVHLAFHYNHLAYYFIAAVLAIIARILCLISLKFVVANFNKGLKELGKSVIIIHIVGIGA